MKDLVFHQGTRGQINPNSELTIGAVIDRDLVETTGVEIEPIGHDLVATIGGETEVKNPDLVVISLRLVQEIVEPNDPNLAVLTVEQIVLSLVAIINLEIGVTNRGLAQIVEGEIDPNLAVLETVMTDPNLEIHQGVFQTKTGHRLVVAQEGHSKNQVKDLLVATAMATLDLQVIEVIDQNLVGQTIAMHQGLATVLRLIEKGDLTNQGLQPHTKETMLQNLEITKVEIEEIGQDLAQITKALTARDLVATSRHLDQEIVEQTVLNSEAQTAVVIVQNLEVLIVDRIGKSSVVIAERVNLNLRGKKDNSTSLALSTTTHLSLLKNSINPKQHPEQDCLNSSLLDLSQLHLSENTTNQQNKKERNILTTKNQKPLAFRKQTRQILPLHLKVAKENLIAL